jgi:hypothetical protein
MTIHQGCNRIATPVGAAGLHTRDAELFAGNAEAAHGRTGSGYEQQQN